MMRSQLLRLSTRLPLPWSTPSTAPLRPGLQPTAITTSCSSSSTSAAAAYVRRCYASSPSSGARRPPPSRKTTGNAYLDDKDLPFLDRRLPKVSQATLIKWLTRYIAYVAVPVALGLVIHSEWTRDERLEAEVYSNRKYTTRFRLPTKSDPQNVREDSWKVVSRSEAERVLRRAERSVDVDSPGNIVKRIDTSAVAANAPIEDREADAIVSGPEGDSSFFAVFDLKRLLSSLVPVGGSAGLQPAGSLTEVERTVQVIQDGFEALDRSIVWDPVGLLPSQKRGSPAEAGSSSPGVQDGYAALLPALSGSCALVSYLPPDQSNLYVALAGDCRAVAGYWVPPGVEGETGQWRVKVLTEDQTGRSEKEVKRLQAEHPGEDVVRRGRVLGGLEPSRAFGDARYKWPRAVQEQLYEAFLPAEVEGKQPRPTPPLSKTPPYVTARPEVTCLPIKGTSVADGELRFLVLATDGLYDRLSNEAIVGLVGAHLADPTVQGAVPKSDVLARVVAADGEQGFDGKKEAVRQRKESTDGAFMFGKDLNAATLLIRNSLAGANERHMRELLSVKSPVTRFMRDDTTVKVIFFNERPAKTELVKPTRSWTELFWRGEDD